MARVNNQKQNNRQRQPRQKVTPVTATALFLDFPTAIGELRAAHPAIESFFSELQNDAEYDEYVAYVSQKAAENVPQLIGKKNIHTQYTISGTNVFIRTEDQLAFGWTVTYKVEDGHAMITSVKNTIIMYDTFQDLKDELSSKSWTLEERKSKRPDSSK